MSELTDADRMVLGDAAAILEAADPEGFGWYYLSFVDTNQAYREEDDFPGGPRWLGGCFVQAHGVVTAGREAWSQGCNPGGQVACWGPFVEGFAPREGYRNRLLTTEAEIEAAEPDSSAGFEESGKP